MRWTPLALAFFLTACSSTEPADPAAFDPIPFRTLAQDRYGSEDAGLVVIRSQAEEDAFLAGLDSPRFPETVRYGSEMVVGVRLGMRGNTGFSVDVFAIEADADGATVHAQETDRGGGRTALTYPSHFVVTQRVEGAVVLVPVGVVRSYEDEAP